MPKDSKPTEKKFSLKPSEIQLLQSTNLVFRQLMSNQMSMIAIERFAYPVSENTQFVFSDDLSEVTISERQQQAEEDQPSVVGE